MNTDNLEKELLKFDGDRFSSLENYINNNPALNPDEKMFFKKLWSETCEFKLWNRANLNTGKRKAKTYLINTYNLRSKSIEKIVQAISYEWL